MTNIVSVDTTNCDHLSLGLTTEQPAEGTNGAHCECGVWHDTYGVLSTSDIQCGDHIGYGALIWMNIVHGTNYGTWSNMVTDRP